MTTLTNSEGKVLTCTNDFIETILLQVNPSNNYYTTGDVDIIFIKKNRSYYSIDIILYLSYK